MDSDVKETRNVSLRDSLGSVQAAKKAKGAKRDYKVKYRITDGAHYVHSAQPRNLTGNFRQPEVITT